MSRIAIDDQSAFALERTGGTAPSATSDGLAISLVHPRQSGLAKPPLSRQIRPPTFPEIEMDALHGGV